MDLNRTPAEISRSMAEEARALNHRTLKADALENAPDVSTIADNIAAVIQRLPQALQQLEASLQAIHDDGRIRLADRPPHEVTDEITDEAVFTALAGLREARYALAGVEERLRSATRVLSNLGGPWPTSEEDDEV